MTVDGTHDHAHSRSAMSVAAHVDSDGLLLYVSQASYEEGSSPLSCWIPNKPVTERLESSSEGDGPLDVFQRCVGPVISRPLVLTVYQPGSAAHSKESWCARLDGHVDTNPRNFIIHDPSIFIGHLLCKITAIRVKYHGSTLRAIISQSNYQSHGTHANWLCGEKKIGSYEVKTCSYGIERQAVLS